MAFQPTKDLADAEADRLFGIKTFFTEWGRAGALEAMERLWCACVLAAAVVAVALPWAALVLVAALVMGPWCLWAVGRPSPTENDLAWALYYAGLAAMYVAALAGAAFI